MAAAGLPSCHVACHLRAGLLERTDVPALPRSSPNSVARWRSRIRGREGLLGRRGPWASALSAAGQPRGAAAAAATGGGLSAAVAVEQQGPVGQSAEQAVDQVLLSPPEMGAITYLEGNTWLLEVGGVRFLVDPILEGPVDFGVPALLKIWKKQLEGYGVERVAPAVDAVLLTQALDDHLHPPTLAALARLRPDIPIIAPPSARGRLEPLFSKVFYVKHGESISVNSFLEPRLPGWDVAVRATVGAMVGMPWQSREHGFIVSCAPSSASPAAESSAQAQGDNDSRSSSSSNSRRSSFSVYLEPHGLYEAQELQGLHADAVVSQTIRVKLGPGLIFDGMESAVQLAQMLGAKKFVGYCSDDANVSGLLRPLLSGVEGSRGALKELMSKQAPSVEFYVPEVGTRIILCD